MEWERNEQLEIDLLQEMSDEDEDNTRTHPSATDLIYCLTKTYRDAHSPIPRGRNTQVMFLTGLGLERKLLNARRQVKHVEIEGRGGISFHPDSFTDDVILGEDRLIELKTTRMWTNSKSRGEFSPETCPEGWHKQAKSYAYMLGVKKVSFVVIFLVQGELRSWDVEYTDDELAEHWAWMRMRKRAWDIAEETEQVPESFKWNAEWECGEGKGDMQCRYLMWCKTRSL